MTKDTNVWSGASEKRSPFFAQLPCFKHDMPNRNTEPIQVQQRLGRKTALLVLVYVAGNRRHWSDVLQVIDDGGLADITGMHDMIDMLEMLLDCQVEQAMRVGDDSDAEEP